MDGGRGAELPAISTSNREDEEDEFTEASDALSTGESSPGSGRGAREAGDADSRGSGDGSGRGKGRRRDQRYIRTEAQSRQGCRRDLHCEVRNRDRCAPGERLQRTEARTNVTTWACKSSMGRMSSRP